MQHGLPEQAIEPTASRTGANKLGYRAVKRAFDLTVTAMAVIVLSPLFLILSVIVYLGDPGAVIYGQVRIGKNGKPFKMWKFRSMYRNADQMIDQLSEEQKRQYHTEFKIDNDPRITPVGNFLRKTSLDELPQLLHPSGRAAVLTFHSLEDRLVKAAFARHSTGCTCPPDLPVCVCGHKPTMRVITKKPILPTQEELQHNRRAASAKLRVAQRL